MGQTRKGSPNRDKKVAIRKLKEIYGEDFDPLMKMAEVAVAMHDAVMGKGANGVLSLPDYKMLMESWDKVAQYVTPKLKAVEQTITDDTARTRLSDTEAVARILSIFERANQENGLVQVEPD